MWCLGRALRKFHGYWTGTLVRFVLISWFCSLKYLFRVALISAAISVLVNTEHGSVLLSGEKSDD